MDESAAGPFEGRPLSTRVFIYSGFVCSASAAGSAPAARFHRCHRALLGGHAQFSAVHVLAFAVVVLGRVELPTSTLSV